MLPVVTVLNESSWNITREPKNQQIRPYSDTKQHLNTRQMWHLCEI